MSSKVEAETFHAFTTIMTEMNDIYIRNLDDADTGMYAWIYFSFSNYLSSSLAIFCYFDTVYSFISQGIFNQFHYYLDSHLPSTAEYLVMLYFPLLTFLPFIQHQLHSSY